MKQTGSNEQVLKKISDIFNYCAMSNKSLMNISFNFLKDFNENEEKAIEKIINESENINFKFSALFILSNKINWNNKINSLNAIRMAFYNGDVDKSFLFKEKDFVDKLIEGILGSNIFIKDQYMPFLTISSEKSEENAKVFKNIYDEINKNYKDEAEVLKTYIENLCLNYKVETKKTIERKRVFLSVFCEKKDSKLNSI